MTGVVLLTVNWRLDRSWFPTDTSRPPPSFPLEWSYVTNESAGGRVAVMDEYSAGHDIEKTTMAIRDRRPEVVVISSAPSYLFWRCPPLNITIVRRYVERVREVVPGARVVVVGPHGTVDPQWALKTTGADFVFRGEPEVGLRRALGSGACNQLEELPWLASAERSGAIAPQAGFDDIGQADYTRPRWEAYRPHVWGEQAKECLRKLGCSRGALVEASRGCSFGCPYCFMTSFRNRVRLKPLGMLELELRELRERGAEYIFFIDETFGINWRHAAAVAQLVYRCGLRYGVQTRPGLFSDERVRLLRDTGCVYVELGLEANETNNLVALGKYRSVEYAYAVARQFDKAIAVVNRNIVDVVNTDYMRTSPQGERKQWDNGDNYPPPLMPYPTTVFGNRAVRKYKRHGDGDWDVAENIYIMYSIMSRSRVARWMLRGDKARHVCYRVVALVKDAVKAWGIAQRSRFERLYGEDRRGRQKL